MAEFKSLGRLAQRNPHSAPIMTVLGHYSLATGYSRNAIGTRMWELLGERNRRARGHVLADDVRACWGKIFPPSCCSSR